LSNFIVDLAAYKHHYYDNLNNQNNGLHKGKEIKITKYETILNITKNDLYKNKENSQTEKANSINRIKNTNEKIKKDEKFKCKTDYIVPIIISAAFIGINLALLIYSAWVLNKNQNNNKN